MQPKPSLMERLEWLVALCGTLGIASPADLIPDIIPVVGLLDDAGYALVALAGAWLACRRRRARRASSADRHDGRHVFPSFAEEPKPWSRRN